MPTVVFRHSVPLFVAHLISDVLASYGIQSVDADPHIPGIRWSEPYRGFCTCDYDKALSTFLAENPHSRCCRHPDRECSCGQWVELERWRQECGHSPKCRKAVPNLIICGVGLFLDANRPFATVDMTETKWREWAKRAISEAKGSVAA